MRCLLCFILGDAFLRSYSPGFIGLVKYNFRFWAALLLEAIAVSTPTSHTDRPWLVPMVHISTLMPVAFVGRLDLPDPTV